MLVFALGGQCVINFALGGQCVINFALGGQCFISLPSVGSVLFTLDGEHVLPSVGSTICPWWALCYLPWAGIVCISCNGGLHLMECLCLYIVRGYAIMFCPSHCV